MGHPPLAWLSLGLVPRPPARQLATSTRRRIRNRSFGVQYLVQQRNTYSHRNNLRRATPLRHKDEAGRELRNFVYQAIVRYIPHGSQRLDFAFTAADLLPPSYDNRADQKIAALLLECEWFLLFDIIENFHAELMKVTNRTSRHTGRSEEFRRLLNTFFENEGYAHKIDDDGLLQHRGDEAFESAMLTADIALAAVGSSTARDEIHKALEDLAKRPEPDLTGAIQHSIAGLECVANQACGSAGIELGRLVKSRPDLFPPPLNEVLPKLYGFASNNGRHLTEGQDPEFEEAELVVGVATTVATYLARKLQA